jgi:hypothetical protein
MKTTYNPSHESSYGYYHCPECKAEFFIGGDPLHEVGCSRTTYDECIFVFGPNHHPDGIVTADMIRAAIDAASGE